MITNSSNPNSLRENEPPMNPTLDERSNEDIDKILRGEISAVEAYGQVMEKIEDEPTRNLLQSFSADHSNAVRYWRSQAQKEQTLPEQDSGIWGTVVEAFVGGSKIIGESPALKALRRGEDHGLKVYEDLLESDNISDEQKSMIRNSFMPKQKRHLEILDNIEDKAA